MKYAWIDAHRNQYTVSRLCRVLSVSRSGYCQWRVRTPSARDLANQALDARVATIHSASRRSYGRARIVSHFTRLFKNTFGVTPLIYLANYRIESACRIMLTTNSSLTDIALSHGFCDQSHFIRIFRRQTGLTPHTWRRMTVENQSKDAGPDTSCASHYG